MATIWSETSGCVSEALQKSASSALPVVWLEGPVSPPTVNDMRGRPRPPREGRDSLCSSLNRPALLRLHLCDSNISMAASKACVHVCARARVCARERRRPWSCETLCVDPHAALTSNRNAPFSLQKHLFRPPYVTEVCKTEFCHRLFKECNVALGVARSPEGRFWAMGSAPGAVFVVVVFFFSNIGSREVETFSRMILFKL